LPAQALRRLIDPAHLLGVRNRTANGELKLDIIIHIVDLNKSLGLTKVSITPDSTVARIFSVQHSFAASPEFALLIAVNDAPPICNDSK
jgi:hypothetical protein